MAHPAGESESDARRLKLEFHGSNVTSDAGLLPFRELDDVLGLMVIAGKNLPDGRTGRNGRHDPIGMLRQSVFGRLAGYEDVTLPTPPPKLTVANLAPDDYSGSYRYAPDRAWTVSNAHGVLSYVTKPGGPANVLEPIAKDVFMGSDDERNLLIFRRDDRGK